MARFTLRHPSDGRLRAEYGWDPISSFFVEGWFDDDIEATVSFSALDDDEYDHAQPLRYALEALATLGFFTVADLDEAIALGDEVLPEEMPRRLRQVAEVIGNLRAGSD